MCKAHFKVESAQAVARPALRHISASERARAGPTAPVAMHTFPSSLRSRKASLRLGSARISACAGAGKAAAMSKFEAQQVTRTIAIIALAANGPHEPARASRMTRCRNHSAKARNTQIGQWRRRHHWARSHATCRCARWSPMTSAQSQAENKRVEE